MNEQQHADLVVAGADVLVAPGDLRPAHDVVIAGGRIAAVEPSPSPAREHAAQTLDGRGLLAMPGLVNAHTHSPETAMRGLADGLPLEPWLATLLAVSGPYSEEDHYWSALACAAEMLACGTTAVIDQSG
jgi:cytosine/adenosine deaminase-related metal-dependent hydrolase